MVKFLKNDNVKTALAVIAILATGCFLIPLGIHIFFKGLLFLMEDPITSLAFIGIFLAGMFTNEALGKIDETNSK